MWVISSISVLGVGVTEAGLASKDTPVMKDLYELLQAFCTLQQDGTWKSCNKICVLDMDNVPNNGDTIEKYMQQLAAWEQSKSMEEFLANRVAFMNTMVDQITSEREGNPMVPRCEPTPQKALVVLDAGGDLPPKLSQQPGIMVRSTLADLQNDIALKLRIANGTHTGIAHPLALLKYLQTDILAAKPLFMAYLDSLVKDQIIPGAIHLEREATAVWEDWRGRLIHPHFGLSSFFITQNGPAKGGIRWAPTVVDLYQQNIPTTVGLAFAYAALLRWLTPLPGTEMTTRNDISIGWLDGVDPTSLTTSNIQTKEAKEYADGLRYHLEQGWYEYRCSLQNKNGKPLTELLQDCVGKSPVECIPAIQAYLAASTGGNLESISQQIDNLVNAIAVFYSRMGIGDRIDSLLQELLDKKGGIGFSSSCSDLINKNGSEPADKKKNFEMSFR